MLPSKVEVKALSLSAPELGCFSDGKFAKLQILIFQSIRHLRTWKKIYIRVLGSYLLEKLRKHDL